MDLMENRKFRETDKFPDNFDFDLLSKEDFKKSLRVLQLSKEDINSLTLLNESLNNQVGEVYDTNEYKLNHVEILNFYINNVINPLYYSVDRRLELILNNIKINGSVDWQINFIEKVCDNLIDLVLELSDDKKFFSDSVKVINKIISMDTSILWKLYEDHDVKIKNKSGSDFKNAMSFLPNLVYTLKRNCEGTEFIIEYVDGSMLDERCESYIGKDINLFISEFGIPNVHKYIHLAVLNGMAEFNVTVNDHVFRSVIRSSKIYEDGIEYIEIKGSTFDITELNTLEDISTALAYHDSLTGLPNRDFYNKKLSECIVNNKEGNLIGVMFIDLDDFKLINDSLGHAAGDELLIEISRRLEDSVRSGDMVSRFGGDEFTIICRSVKEKKDLEIIVGRILSSVCETPYIIKGEKFHVTLSIGISIYPADGEDVDVMVKNADVAMYRAKNNGKNSHKFFDSSMNREVISKLEMQSDLRNAISRGEMYLEYQVQYESNKRKIIGLEALLRWKHPERGIVPPEDFIEIAETSGLIVEVGYWVLEEACKRIVELQETGNDDIIIGVNYSSLQLTQKNLIRDVKRVLDKTGANPNQLMIEISESTSMDNVSFTSGLLKDLSDLGILISIDDFGTGLSSISFLTEFTLNNIKIDRSLVNKVDIAENSQVVVKSIINLASNLGFDVVAEGIETKDQFDIIRDLGCTKFQGYYFGKPVAFEEILNRLEEG